MKTSKHGNLIDKDMAGNGYHGRCEHCGLACVTDLGYFSWEGTKCIEREIVNEKDVPENIRSYAKFFGMIFKVEDGKAYYTKPYVKDYQLEELESIIKKLNDERM